MRSPRAINIPFKSRDADAMGFYDYIVGGQVDHMNSVWRASSYNQVRELIAAAGLPSPTFMVRVLAWH